jgi:hypothetical protein
MRYQPGADNSSSDARHSAGTGSGRSIGTGIRRSDPA